MFSQSGRLVKKKKTTVKVNTKDPVFNETLNFEVILEHCLDTSKHKILYPGSSRTAGHLQVPGDLVEQEAGAGHEDHGG